MTLLILRSTHHRITTRMEREIEAAKRGEELWRRHFRDAFNAECDASRLLNAERERAAEQALVIEELQARLARFERCRGEKGRFVKGEA